MSNKEDPILKKLETAISKLAEQADKSGDYAILALGVHGIIKPGSNEANIDVYWRISGRLDLLLNGLLTAVLEHADSGDFTAYAMLRDVVDQIEEKYDTEISNLDEPDSSLH